MTDIKLLPLPEGTEAGEYMMDAILFDHSDMTSYARANVSHATAAKDAEIERLREEVAKAERSVEHTHQWYAVRLEKIKEVAKRVGLWSEVAAIIANGSSPIYDPPTYAQQLNIAKHEKKEACARAERLAEALQHMVSEAIDGGHNYMMQAIKDSGASELLRDQGADSGERDG